MRKTRGELKADLEELERRYRQLADARLQVDVGGIPLINTSLEGTVLAAQMTEGGLFDLLRRGEMRVGPQASEVRMTVTVLAH